MPRWPGHSVATEATFRPRRDLLEPDLVRPSGLCGSLSCCFTPAWQKRLPFSLFRYRLGSGGSLAFLPGEKRQRREGEGGSKSSSRRPDGCQKCSRSPRLGIHGHLRSPTEPGQRRMLRAEPWREIFATCLSRLCERGYPLGKDPAFQEVFLGEEGPHTERTQFGSQTHPESAPSL